MQKKHKKHEPIYRVCNRCVMDTSDPLIRFDDSGNCNHCCNFFKNTVASWFPNEEGEILLSETIKEIKREGEGKEYDCIIGLSGGIDSSYLALNVKKYGLRALAVHIDAGWNSELAVANIETLVKKGGFDLITHVVDWSEMRDLQVAYLRSGVANQDVPQDHIFFAELLQYAYSHGIHYVLSGGNFATESIFPEAWHCNAMDSSNLKAIHRKYGKKRLSKYNTVGWFNWNIRYPFMNRIRFVRPLDYMPYNTRNATEELKGLGFKPYKTKHGESRFTKFFQNYYLPKKFGYDKRRPHLSSLIVSEQINRKEALTILEEPLYDPKELDEDFSYIAKKLQLSNEELMKIIDAKNGHYKDFDNWDLRNLIFSRVLKTLSRIKRLIKTQ